MNDIKAQLRVLLVKSLRLERTPESIPDENLIHELGVDSVAMLEILVWVENEFGIEIHDNELSSDLINSLNTLATFIHEHRKAKLAAGTVEHA